MLSVFAFYLFSAVLLVAGALTILSRNPVYSVLWLILAFFNAAGLMLLLGAEFIAMLLVIVYVGAVAVLFLFVVMMLDIDFAELRAGFAKYLPLGAIIALGLAGELIVALQSWRETPFQQTIASKSGAIPASMSNIEAMGQIIYTRYLFLFEIAGFILLVAMIGAIMLTNRRRSGVRKQDVAMQNERRPQDATRLVNQPVGQGVEL